MRRLFVPLLALLAAIPARAVRVDYAISVKAKADHVHVSAVINDDPDASVTVAMPVWIPGFYKRLDQYKNVSNMIVSEGGKALAVEQPTPDTWRVTHTPNAPLAVEYDDKADDDDATMGQFGVYVDRDTAFIHPGTACVYVSGHKDAPATVALDIPRRWDAAMPLPRLPDGRFAAPNYDVLDDSPLQLGRFGRIPFIARGHHFEIITVGRPRVSDETLRDVCRREANATIDLFHGWTPFTDYQFHFHFPPKRPVGGAGLEHRSSTVIVFGNRTDDAAFRGRSARIVNHEFFHAWNVKSLRPAGLGPFDYQHEVRTPSLWQAEGFTDYYAFLLAARSGVWTPDETLAGLTADVREYNASPGRDKTSAAESSMGVWGDNGFSNGSGGTNYYTKGALSAWLLDIEIRAATGNKRSLDDAMRWMAGKYAAKEDVGYPPDALLTAIKEAAGVDVTADYNAFIHGTGAMPFERVLPMAGLKITQTTVPDTMLGADMDRGAKEPIVRAVEKGSAAEDARLLPGDVLLKIDDEPVTIGRRALLAGKDRAIGDRVPILIRRAGQEELVTVIVQGKPSIAIAPNPVATPAQNAVCAGLTASDRYETGR